jgi:hypothetical protein
VHLLSSSVHSLSSVRSHATQRGAGGAGEQDSSLFERPSRSGTRRRSVDRPANDEPKRSPKGRRLNVETRPAGEGAATSESVRPSDGPELVSSITSDEAVELVSHLRELLVEESTARVADAPVYWRVWTTRALWIAFPAKEFSTKSVTEVNKAIRTAYDLREDVSSSFTVSIRVGKMCANAGRRCS